MLASCKDHLQTVDVLLAHKADVNAENYVSQGEGCESALMGARSPWTGCRGLWSGFCYGLMQTSDGLGRGVKMVVIRGRCALVCDVRAVEQADNPMALDTLILTPISHTCADS